MKIKSQEYNNVFVLELHGEYDHESVGMLENNITDLVSRNISGIVLDMNNIEFIDSAALEELLWVKDFCDEKNCQLKLAALDENCLKILEITRLENKFDLHNELAHAVKSFV
jgi:anti-anti-sigma factor